VVGDPERICFCFKGVRSALKAFAREAIGVRSLLRELRLLLLEIDGGLAECNMLRSPQAERLRRARRALAECSGPGVRMAFVDRSREPVWAARMLPPLAPMLLSSVR